MGWNMMSYDEYLNKTGSKSTRNTWINWKISCWDMEPDEAFRASYDPEWGWSEREDSI